MLEVHLQQGEPDKQTVEVFLAGGAPDAIVILPYRADGSGQVVEWGLVSVV